MVTKEGNEAAASAACRLAEVVAIYPITPSTPMGGLSDEWAAKGMPNEWGSVPSVVEMQAEGGAAGAVPPLVAELGTLDVEVADGGSGSIFAGAAV